MVLNQSSAIRFQGPRPTLRGEVSLARLSFERGPQMMRLYRNWPVAIADRLGLISAKRRVLYRLKSTLGPVELMARMNGSDVRTINEVWIGQLYDRCVDSTGAGDRQTVIVDLGTNCGYFAVYAGRKYPGARIVCFEPEAENRALAHINMALNGIDAEIHSQAVVPSDAEGITLNLSDDPRLHTTVRSDFAAEHGLDQERYTGRTVNVPAIEINRALAPLAQAGYIDLLKIDVEGLELDLLEALHGATLSAVLCISAEVGNQDTARAADHLRQHGFTVSYDAGLLNASRRAERKDRR